MEDAKERGVAEGEVNLLELLQVLVRRRKMVAGCCLGAALLSAGYSMTLPNIYSATSTVLPPQKEGSSGLSALLGQAGGLAGLAAGMGGGGSSELYLGIVRSRSVGDAVIKRLDLVRTLELHNLEEARRELRSAVKAQAGKDGIISVTAEARSPELAARLANAMVDELGSRSVQLNLTKAGNERAFLEKRLEVVKGDLKRAEEELKGFQEANRTIKVDAQATASIEAVARVKADLVGREVQLASLKASQTDESPEVKALQTAIARLRSQMGSLEGRGGKDAIPSVGNVPALGLQYLRRMRDLKVQEAIFEQLTKQYEMAKFNEAKDTTTLQVLDEAIAPLHKSKPVRSLIVLGATFAAFLLSVLAAFAAEYLQRVTEEDRKRLEEIKTLLIPWKRAL